MKAEDLMIGDWVQSFGEPHKIIGIRTDTPYPYIKTNMSDTWYEWGMKDLADGIPITPEILDKNGFGFIDTSNGELSSIWTGWWILESLELGCCDNSKFPVFFNIADTNVKVDYVHELQHALRLCKIKKEIVL